MARLSWCSAVCAIALWVPAPALAQTSLADFGVVSERQEQLGDKHWILTGSVELERGDTKIYADEVEFFEDQDRAVARGNVVFTQGANRIAADSAEFDVKTALGTFFHAHGLANMQPPRQAPQPGGIAVPQVAGQEVEVIFFGEKIEKLGAKKYRIFNGGFSTCLQPAPRWSLSAESVVLNIDHYTLLRQAIFKVKGVPMFYLPIFYYPTKEDGRATGFLLPTYGVSTIRGQTLHGAFFWAINRSHDATFLYDWYSKTGTGGGAEYRYALGRGSGSLTAYRLDERSAQYQGPSGTTTSTAQKSYTINGSATHVLPANFQARARVNYFSSITTNQTFNANIYDASRNSRSYGGNVVGSWRSYSLNGTVDRSEWFNTTTSSAVTGSSPRLSVSRSERPLYGNAPVYLGMGGEFARLDRQTRSSATVIDDRSVTRLDFSPRIRYPFKKWPWFTVNTSANWRETFYTRSLDPSTRIISGENLNRQYFTVLAQTVGPVLTRVWNTPDNGYAERFKHSIEPYFNIQRTSAILQREQIVQVDGIDTPYGDTTQVTYGLNNRLYAKRRVGQFSQAQEIVGVDIQQSYYTDARQSLVDPSHSTSYSGGAPTKFSPISLGARLVPTQEITATLRAEIDSRYHELRTLSLNTNYNWTQRVQASVGWSHKFFIEELSGFNNPANLDHYVNVSTIARTRDSRYGTNYSFNYDVLRSTMTQQRLSAFYNAQCCGIAVEFQRYNFAGQPAFVVPADNRFFLSFTLAGLGNFSPLSGGLSGVPR